ncbi:MAG: AraC family transcriptional regulator [Clostridiales bacterium]|jgi:AraC family transcriptional regulator|nr:AraC family transcriptional regulator [Clostridiales bacterium]
MDLTKGIQRAVNYIEENILSELSVEEIAERAYLSPFYFQRLFSLLSGISVGEYIRNRRLSMAAVDLQTNGLKVIELALKYGYDTPESFSRAFVRFHGILPSAAKANGTEFKLFSPLSIKVTLKGGSVLTYRLEEMQGFRLIGKAVRSQGYEIPAQLWQKCFEDGTTTTLCKKSASPRREIIGLTDGTSFDGKAQMYYVATIYGDAPVPKGYVAVDIPPRLWVKFFCGDITERNVDSEIWQRIYSEYFPASDYVPGDYQMVVYPAGDGDYPDVLGEIWIDVRRISDVRDESV